jgi:uncharacterized protein YbbC (DUF1343 family)/CubicO group peptidase (beta-lactamase class C family)
MSRQSTVLFLVFTCLWFTCVSRAESWRGFAPEKLRAMDRAIDAAIADGKCPGGVLWLERQGVVYCKAYGNRALVPAVEPMTTNTVFDAASLTKVIATTPSLLKLTESGKVDLEAPVSRYIEGFRGEGREKIRIRHLLTHTSGLRAGLGPRGDWSGNARAIEFACTEVPTDPPDKEFRYSDINFILLGEVIRRVSGQSLDAFSAATVFRPLGMEDTGFLPSAELRPRLAPTEKLSDGTVLRGVVHDPTARRMGGVAGHAGLFTTAPDLARYVRALLARGQVDGTRLLKGETVDRMTSVNTPAGVKAKRGLGWDIDSPYAGPRGDIFPVGSYGHTGWTGTSVWIDPGSGTFVVFLSNRNHPKEEGNVIALRRELGTLAAAAAGLSKTEAKSSDRPPEPSKESGGVMNGIDVLVKDGFKPFRGKKVGLITNHTGIDRNRHATIDLLREAAGVELVALFSPEHGIRGVLDEKVPDGRDEKTGLPIYSLYGENRAPKPEQLAGLDLLVFDLQDIGCRFYTYISTLGESLMVAARVGVPFVVLDRVNPITGVRVEGPVLEGERSFVGWHDIPLRHGMTAGELARMFQKERGVGGALTVIPCEGWSRSAWFDATSLPWINTSPNMRSLTQATLYPGVGMVEMCNISVGRGTDAPFEKVGAPYVDDRALAKVLNGTHLPGYRFVPIRFTPTVNKFAGKECGGVQILLTDRDTARSVDLGIVLARELHRLHPVDFGVERVGKLLLHPHTLEMIRDGASLEAIRKEWEPGLNGFLRRRAEFLIYN